MFLYITSIKFVHIAYFYPIVSQESGKNKGYPGYLIGIEVALLKSRK